MGKKASRGFSQDLSSFMCIILMLIGVMVIMLITNTVVIVSNPENIRITSIIQSSGEYLEGGKGEDAGAPRSRSATRRRSRRTWTCIRTTW